MNVGDQVEIDGKKDDSNDEDCIANQLQDEDDDGGVSVEGGRSSPTS